MLAQLPHFSVEQAASALASMRTLAPTAAVRSGLLTAVAQHSSGEVRLQSADVRCRCASLAFISLAEPHMMTESMFLQLAAVL